MAWSVEPPKGTKIARNLKQRCSPSHILRFMLFCSGFLCSSDFTAQDTAACPGAHTFIEEQTFFPLQKKAILEDTISSFLLLWHVPPPQRRVDLFYWWHGVMTDIHCALLASDEVMASDCGQHSLMTLLSLVNLWTSVATCPLSPGSN